MVVINAIHEDEVPFVLVFAVCVDETVHNLLRLIVDLRLEARRGGSDLFA